MHYRGGGIHFNGVASMFTRFLVKLVDARSCGGCFVRCVLHLLLQIIADITLRDINEQYVTACEI